MSNEHAAHDLTTAQERNDATAQLTRDIAGYLGPEWHGDIRTCLLKKPSQPPRYGFRFEISSKHTGFPPQQVRGGWARTRVIRRVHIFGYWSSEDAQYRPHPETPTKITVAYNRGAATIAAEIKRRLLPVYESEWHEMNATRARVEAEHKSHAIAIEKLVTATGGTTLAHWVKYRESSSEWPPYISSQPMNQIEVDCSDGTAQVSFIVDGITLAQALAVAAVLYPERQAAK